MAGSSAAEPGSGRVMSLAEWADRPEDESGELVDGLLVEDEVPDFIHESVVTWLVALFRAWIVPRGGFVGGSDAKFAVTTRRGRKPDLSVYMPGRKPQGRGVIDIPPDVMVEVVSPAPRDGRRDRVEKVDEYARFGVRLYWIVDPQFRSLEILQLGAEGSYVHVLGATAGTVEKVPGCEGLQVNLDELWAEVDRLES